MKGLLCIMLMSIFFLEDCSLKNNDFTNKVEATKVYKISNKNEDYFDWDKVGKIQKIIPLESNERSVIGSFYKCEITDDKIIVGDIRFNNVYIFNQNGAFITKLGHMGKGPEEYMEMRDFCIREHTIYTLDYQKIHSYNLDNGKYLSSIIFKNVKGFNPTNLIVYDKDNFYLWNSNPDLWNPNDGEYYRLLHYIKNKPKNKYFKYDYNSNDDNRFFPRDDSTYYMKPIDGDYTIYLVNNESVLPAFKLDFNNDGLTPREVNKLRNSKEKNAYYKSKYYKNVFNLFELNDHIYFSCIGPEARKYEGIINKESGTIEFGLFNSKRSPQIFYSDGKNLYGYMEPDLLLQKTELTHNNIDILKTIKDKVPDVKVEDNIIIVKISIK